MTSTEDPEFEPVRLGKNIELRYLPFSELIVPSNVSLDTATSKDNSQTKNKNGKPTKKIRTYDVEALKRSIAKFGLLKPLEVAEITERLDYFYGKAKYLVIDGQRRYFAIRELLKLPTDEDEKNQRDNLRTTVGNDVIANLEFQAQEQFDKLSIRDYVLLPCIVYPYTTLLQMVRHSIEDKRFSERPPKEDYDLVEKMVAQGIADLHSDDLRKLWKTRCKIEEERNSIEKTLQEIRDRVKQKEMKDQVEIVTGKTLETEEETA